MKQLWTPAVILAGLFTLPGFGQITDTRPDPYATAVGRELDRESVEAEIKRVESAPIEPNAKAIALSLYKQALEQLNSAQIWTQQSSHLDQLRREIPGEIARLKTRLSQAASRPASQPWPYTSPDMSLEEIDQRLRNAEIELKTRHQTLTNAEEIITSRADRRTLLVTKMSECGTALAEVRGKLDDAPGTAPEVTAAQRVFLLSRQKALELEFRAYLQELNAYDGMGVEFLTARRDVARLDMAEAEAMAARWRQAANRKTLDDIDRQHSEAERQLAKAPRELRELAEQARQFAEERRQINDRIGQTVAKSKALEEKAARLDSDLKSLRDRLRVGGVVADLGPILNRQKAQLPEIGSFKREDRIINDSVARAQVRLLELEELRTQAADTGSQSAVYMGILERANPKRDVADFKPDLERLLQVRSDAIDSLRLDYETCWNNLIALGVANKKAIASTQSLLEFINEHALWLPSDPPITRAVLPSLRIPHGTWSTLRDAFVLDALAHPILYGMLLFLFTLCLAASPRIRRTRQQIDRRVAHFYTDSFGLTVKALMIDLLLAGLVPALMWFAGSRIESCVPADNAEAFTFCSALGIALQRTSLPLFVGLFFWRLFRAGGVGEAHFQWNAHVLSVLSPNLRWMVCFGVPLSFVAWFAAAQDDPRWNASLGRAAFIAFLFLAMAFGHRVLHPTKGVLMPTIKLGSPQGSLSRRFWHLTATLLPLTMAIACCMGYSYTAEEFTRRLFRTIALIVGLLVVRSTIVRAAITSDRALKIRNARDELGTSSPASTGHDPESAALEHDLHLSEELGDKTRTLLRWVVAFGLIIGIWAIWQDLVPALNFVGRIQLWSHNVVVPAQVAGAAAHTTTVAVSLADLMLAVLTLAATVALAVNGPAAAEMLMMSWLPVDRGTRFALAAVLRYVIVIVGGVLAFGRIGIQWSQIQWLAAAITVGLGFGLQEIVANLVSGLIILFERPVRIGDIVTVGGIDGKITRIRIRATTVTDWNRRELIVPNKEFITGQIINWTLSDPVTRVDIPVGIAYGSDTRLARNLLLRVADECEHVLDRPAPEALFNGFGDSTLEFQLRVHIPNRDVWAQVIHNLHTRIDDEFRKAKIEIAFPQRDIHIRSMPEDIQIVERANARDMGAQQVSKPIGDAMPGCG